MDDGFVIAAGFFALGLFWLFGAAFSIVVVSWVRQLLG